MLDVLCVMKISGDVHSMGCLSAKSRALSVQQLVERSLCVCWCIELWCACRCGGDSGDSAASDQEETLCIAEALPELQAVPDLSLIHI